MKTYKLVERYVRNRMADKQPSTREQAVEKISRVLEELEQGYGVTVGEESVCGLTPLVMSDWQGARAAKSKPATVNCYVAMMKPFLRWLEEVGITPQDCSRPLRFLKIPNADELPEEERPKDKYLTHEQVEQLLSCPAGYNAKRDRAIMALILYSGLRSEEVSSLNIGDVLKKRGELVVKRKGGHYKTVYVADDWYPYIADYLATRRDKDNPNAPLFTTSHGNRCTASRIYYALSFKQDKLGLATGGHALRHTFVSEVEKLAGAGVARDLANHSSLVVTNRYTHTTKEQLRQAVGGLNW